MFFQCQRISWHYSNIYHVEEGTLTCPRPAINIDRPIAMSGINDEVDHDDLIEAENAMNQETLDELESEDSSDEY